MQLFSVRNRANHVSKAKSLIVAGLNIVAPRDAGYLWEVVRKSGSVEKELGIEEQQEEKKISLGSDVDRIPPKRVFLGNEMSNVINHGGPDFV